MDGDERWAVQRRPGQIVEADHCDSVRNAQIVSLDRVDHAECHRVVHPVARRGAAVEDLLHCVTTALVRRLVHRDDPWYEASLCRLDKCVIGQNNSEPISMRLQHKACRNIPTGQHQAIDAPALH